jgi:lipopolysaccharide export system protein LptA
MVMKTKAKKSWGAAALAAVLLATPAAAQFAQNSDAPVDLTADELEVVNAQCLAIWRGSAEALQDTSRLRANVLKIYNRPGAAKSGQGMGGSNCGPGVERIEAQGDVFYVTPNQRVRGDLAIYEKSSDTIVMTGDVVAVQGRNVLRGQRMVINVKSGEAQMQTSAKGRNQPGRVRGVFYPSENRPAAAAPKTQ